MKATADKHRRDVHFQVGDMVLVKLQPYRQSSVQGRATQKLSARYYGPYKVAAKLGQVTYRLELPMNSKVHPVFQVSTMKRVAGQQPTEAEFPTDIGVEERGLEPETFC